jgi:glutathione-regulated potassium-efflux system ancillary protein KefF
VRDLPGVAVGSLYDLYPDFDIDAGAEQAALEGADLVALMHPLYWYSMPAMLKHWIDVVLADDWAHVAGGGNRLRGKECLWIATAGDVQSYAGAPTPVVEQVARACGMKWLDPFIVDNVHELSREALVAKGAELRARLQSHA